MTAWWLGTVLVFVVAACAAPAPPRAVQPAEGGPGILDLASLTRMADLVIVGRVSAPGQTRDVAQPQQTPVGPTRVVPGPASSSGGGISVPVTTYRIDVERVARGSGTPGSQLSVMQSGNPIRQAAPSQDDVPLAAGERYVLFLQKVDPSTFVIVGDIQGRLSIDAQGRVHPVGSGSPATRGHDGQPVDAFLNDVSALS